MHIDMEEMIEHLFLAYRVSTQKVSSLPYLCYVEHLMYPTWIMSCLSTGVYVTSFVDVREFRAGIENAKK